MSGYAVTNPATGVVERRFDSCTDEDVARGLDDAGRGFGVWSGTDVAVRAGVVGRIASSYRDRREELAGIIHREMGKLMDEALAEVDFSADIYQYYADHGAGFLADVRIDRQAPGSAVLRRLPIGVLLGVMPWNYPYYQVARFAAPNLMLGNVVLLKHAALCPESSAAMEDVVRSAGAPEGVFRNLYATFGQVSAIIADPRVRGVSLTGSERAGASIARQAGEHLKKVVCELGGSDPFVLLGSDDLDAAAAAGVAARFENCGQICNGAKRFIVLDSLYDGFLRAFMRRASGLRLAPMCSLSAAERLSSQVHHALEQGARLAMGSADNRGAYFDPAVLVDVPEGADARREEFFGPVAQFYRVFSQEEAVAVANDTPFGLGSYVFATDVAQARRVADALQTGMTYINEVGADSCELPFGGVKSSGFGRELGALGIGEFANVKLETIDRPGAF